MWSVLHAVVFYVFPRQLRMGMRIAGQCDKDRDDDDDDDDYV